jgi:hypothetical protein
VEHYLLSATCYSVTAGITCPVLLPIAPPLFSRAPKRKNTPLQVLCLPLLRTPSRATPSLATHTQTPGIWVPCSSPFNFSFSVCSVSLWQTQFFQAFGDSLPLLRPISRLPFFVFNGLRTLRQNALHASRIPFREDTAMMARPKFTNLGASEPQSILEKTFMFSAGG